MFGTQIAMAFDQRGLRGARPQKRRESLYGRIDAPADAQRDLAIEIRKRMRQNREIAAVLGNEPRDINFRREFRTLCRAIEAREEISELVDFAFGETVLDQQPIEHDIRRQPAHDHQPIDDLASSAESKFAAGANRERSHAQIKIRREPPIEPHFFLAIGLPCGKAREIERRAANRLLQFIDAILGQKDIGHMRLFDLDLHNRAAIGRG